MRCWASSNALHRNYQTALTTALIPTSPSKAADQPPPHGIRMLTPQATPRPRPNSAYPR